MKKKTRMLMEVLLPPALASVFFVVIMASNNHGQVEPLMVGFVVIAAYLYATIPSILCAAAMELAFERGLSPASWRAVGAATIAGAIAGCVIGMVISDRRSFNVIGWLQMVAMGIAVGATTGLCIKIGSRARSRPEN